MENRIYFFTGTGNSLRAAEKIGEKFKKCEIIAITDKADRRIPSDCQRIGFVFPVYFQGIPKMVEDFINESVFPQQRNMYYFAVSTYGALYGNAIPQLERVLRRKSIHLSYNKNLKMFSNYVAMYDMSTNVEKITENSERDIDKIALDILSAKENKVALYNPVLNLYYRKQIGRVHGLDENFSVSEDCVACGRCAAVCPSSNIKMTDGYPQFQHHCNQCMACIQFCPKRAINYKNVTQKRRRYTHPEIGYRKLIQYYD